MRIKFPPRYFSNPQSFYGSFPSINTERKYASFSIPQHSLAMAKPRICLSRCRIKIITYIFFLSYFLLNYQKFKISTKKHKKKDTCPHGSLSHSRLSSTFSYHFSYSLFSFDSQPTLLRLFLISFFLFIFFV
jgi:hypothetical protein